jgi:Subtilase family
MTALRRYVLLPEHGLLADREPAQQMLASMPDIGSTVEPVSLEIASPTESAPDYDVRLIDTTQHNGPRLVEITETTAAALNDEPGLRAVPEVEYGRPNPVPQPLDGASAALAGSATPVLVKCIDATTGQGVAGVRVIAFTNFSTRTGDEGLTDATGNVTLQLASLTIDRLYAYAPAGYWGAFRSALVTTAPISLSLTPVDLGFVDAVRFYYGKSNFAASAGVTVGVLDTGVGPHNGINLVGGRNTVTGEPPDEYSDGAEHGTHVSGLIGSNGTPPTGLRGVAPGVAIRAYRVFGKGNAGATNYAILKAMILASQDGCDIINLSLGGGPHDPIVEEAIADARDQGMLTVIAAGNDNRGVVSYPAAYAGATPVTAMGREGAFPPESLDTGEIMRPPSSSLDKDEFIAAFSNIGPQVAVTAPGVGVLSTLPGNLFGPMSGTSMAAPVAVGTVACLLSRDPGVHSMPRTRARGDAIEALLAGQCQPRGFGSIYEGRGLPDPATI